MALRKTASESIVRKGENAGDKLFLLFPLMFSTFPKTNFSFVSTNAINLDKSKVLSFGKELNLYLTCQFWALPIQQQIKI